MSPLSPEKPKFVTSVTWVQKILAGIAGSLFIIALASLTGVVQDLFKPNYLELLSTVRASMAAASLLLAGIVGIPQIGSMIRWLVEFYDYYKKFSELKERKHGKSDDI